MEKEKTSKESAQTKDENKYLEKAENIEKKSKKPLIIGLSIAGGVLVLVALFCVIFSLININNNKILKNISIMGLNVENLTKEEANEKLNNLVKDRLETDIVFKHNDQSFTLLPKEIEFNYDFEKAVDEAYDIGRDGNILQNNFVILGQYFKQQNIVPEISINQELYGNIENQINENLTDGVKNPDYTIEGNKLTVTVGKDGYKVKMKELKESVIKKLIQTEYSDETIEIPVEEAKCKDIDVEEIHKEVYKEPVDASYTKDPFEIHASENGMDFSISVEEAKALITGDKESYVIPVKTLYPKVTTDQIGTEAFPNLLASYSSNYSSSNYNRSTNVALATSKINGIVLMPGKSFSYNGTVGQRTLRAGFKEAGAYANGEVTTAVGGGICQVSSTLYNAVLRANLEVTNRTNHMFQVGYVPIGTDATVSWGAPDFQFKNNRNYPIKIVATTAGKNVYIKIFGLKEDNDYDVEILSYRTGTIPFNTTYTSDPSLGEGQTKVVQNGSNGATSVTYKILKRNGQEVSRELVSRDRYQPHNQVIAKGE